MTLDNYMNITYKNCEMKNKCTDVPADLVNMGTIQQKSITETSCAIHWTKSG